MSGISEALYAILVEGQGPMGSVFSKDDFSDKEVFEDSDGAFTKKEQPTLFLNVLYIF